MIIERYIKVDVTFCCTCGQKLKLNRQCGVFECEDTLVVLCDACSLQIKDLFEILNSGGMIIKDHKKNDEVENVNP